MSDVETQGKNEKTFVREILRTTSPVVPYGSSVGDFCH